jgi:ADP-ribosylglycohydrolase
MPTQELDRARAREILGSPPGFREGPPDNPVAHGLPAGSVTDDTMQCVLVAKLLVEGRGTIHPRAMADALMRWEREMADRGRVELLGPSTRRALVALAAGDDPSLTGRTGTTNGAAMRIAPVGVATPARPLERLLDAVVAADRVTHDTAVAHAGAAVVASVVSAGVDGATFEEASPLATEAANHFGFADLFGEALRMDTVDAMAERFGTGVETQESVVVAFGIARLHGDDAWEACIQAAALGGDADTIAALVGTMVGACTGLRKLPASAVRKVRAVNGLELEPLVERLLALRNR